MQVFAALDVNGTILCAAQGCPVRRQGDVVHHFEVQSTHGPTIFIDPCMELFQVGSGLDLVRSVLCPLTVQIYMIRHRLKVDSYNAAGGHSRGRVQAKRFGHRQHHFAVVVIGPRFLCGRHKGGTVSGVCGKLLEVFLLHQRPAHGGIDCVLIPLAHSGVHAVLVLPRLRN